MAFMADKYSAEQKRAAALAYLDDGIRPARRVRELAATGALELDGEKLPPYEITDDMVRKSAEFLRKERFGLAASKLAQKPNRDAVEALRRRAVSYVDHEMQILERRQKRGRTGAKDHEVMDRLIRMTKNIAALPDHDDPRPDPILSNRAGKVDIEKTLAGPILAANRRAHAMEDPRPSTTEDRSMAENASAAQHASTEAQEAETESGPGEWMRAQLDR